MKKRNWIAGALAAAVVASATLASVAGAATASPGLHVSNGQIVEADGTPFVFRGVNHAHTWYTGQTSSYANMSALGANSVRTVLSSGARWTKNNLADVQNVIQLAKDAKMISIFEVHDTTGYGEQSGAITLDAAVDYWISIKDALIGQEDYVLLNIGNEPYGNNATTNATYVSDTISAIQRLRNAGISNAIVVDAPCWGQDWQYLMRDNARQIFDADPDGNVVFSIHMYGVFGTASAVTSYMDAFHSAGLPLIVGEFGNKHSDGDVDEDTILSRAQSLGIGWLAWSWSGNSSDVGYLDLTNGFDPASLTTWGERVFNGTNGIKATAGRAAIFGGTTPVSTPTTPPTGTGTCSAALAVTGSWTGGFQASVTVTANLPVTAWSTSFTLPTGVSVQNLWLGTATNSGTTYTVTNAASNGTLSAGQSTAYGFVGAGTAPTSMTVSCTGS